MKARLFALVLLLLPVSGPAAAPNLVPATFQPVSDSLGFSWDLDSNGSIQQGSQCFSNAMMLEVNGNTFSAQQSMMTADGAEYFLDGTANNMVISRRIRVDQKNGVIRYYDTVRNGSGSPQTFRATFRVQMSQPMQMAMSDTGAPLGGSLGPKEQGFLLLRPPGQSGPAVLLLASGRNAKLRPTLQNQQNYRVMLTYNLRLAPGEAVSLFHSLGQRALPAPPEAKSLARLFAPLAAARLLAEIPVKERKTLANFLPSSFGSSGPAAPTVLSLLENLGVERGPTDVLAVGAETRLRGTASCTRLEVETSRGRVVVPFENVVAILGGRREKRVLLRDGQALSGQVQAEGLKFTLATGTTIPLDSAIVDRLVMRVRPGEAPASGWGFVETFEGDRFTIQPEAALRLHASTAWGTREVALDDLVNCGPSEENPLGLRMLLKDGSSFFAFLDGDEITFDTALFGRKSFRTSEIRQIAVAPARQAAGEEEAEKPPEQAQLKLAGGQVLTGQIDAGELHFLSPAGVIPIAANLIRTLSNTSEEASEAVPVFTASVWGGSAVSGTLREVVVPVRTASGVFQVPTRDLVEAAVPSPAVPEGLRDKIAILVRDLGHPDWEERERASRELGALGELARAALAEAVRQTTDAEVRRRAQTLLETTDTL